MMYGKCQRLLQLLLVAIVGLSAAPAPVQEPVAVISIRSTDALLSDLKYILSAGGPDLGDLVDGMIDQMTQGKGLVGIDRSKPLGAYMTLNEANSSDFVIFIPVNDNRSFRTDFLSSFFSRQQEVAGGMFSIQSDNQQFYGKFANGHCFLSPLPGALHKLPDPARIVTSKFTFNLDADLSRMPDEVKDGLVEQVEEMFQAAREGEGEPQEPVSELEARIRERSRKITAQLARMLVKETDRLSMGIDVDQKSKLVALDFGVVARPSSPLAQSLANYNKTSASFVSLIGPDAAASVVMAAPLSKDLREFFRDSIQSTIEQLRADIDNSEKLDTPEQKKAAKDLVDRVNQIVHASSEAGSVDAALAIYATSDDKAAMVGASKVASGDEVNRTLEDFLKQTAGTPHAERVRMDVAKHGSARIHAVTLELEGESKDYLASSTVHLAVRSDDVFFAIGGDSLAAVKSAIDKAGKGSSNRPPVSIRLQPSKIVTIFGKGDDPNVELARQAFNGEGDHISMELFSTNQGARLRIELGEGFLRFIALSVSQQLGDGGAER